MASAPRPPRGFRSRKGEGSSRGPYKVGQGRPPIDHQWKPGQSGNKKGRKKGSKNRKTIVRAAARKLFKITNRAGRPRKLTTTEMGLHHLQQDVAHGDRKAFKDWMELLERYDDSDTATSMQELLAEDRAILANMLARKVLKNPPADEGDSS